MYINEQAIVSNVWYDLLKYKICLLFVVFFCSILSISAQKNSDHLTDSTGNSLPARKKTTDSLLKFTYACSGGLEWTVSITNDGSKPQAVIIKSNRKDTTNTYSFYSLFDPANFTAWLLNRYAPQCSLECALGLSSRVINQLQILPSSITGLAGPLTVLNNMPPTTGALLTVTTTTNSASGTTATANTDATKKSADKTAIDTLIHLDDQSTSINPVYKKDSVGRVPINVMLIRDTMPVGDVSVAFHVEQLRFPVHLEITSQNPVSIKKSEWKSNKAITGSDKKVYDSVEIDLKYPHMPDTLNADEFANVRLDGKDTSFHQIRLTEKGMYNPNSVFWMDLGTNFDLLDGIQTNNLYSGIYMFDKDVAKLFRNGQKSIGFTGGVYETKSSSFSASSDSGYIYRDATSFNYDSAHHGFPYYRDTGTVNTTTSVQSIGIFFSPHYRLTNSSSNENGLHIYFSTYFEMLWQRVKSSFDYSGTNKFKTLYADSNHYYSTIQPLSYKESAISTDYRSQYVGIGFPIYIKENSFTLYINDVFGKCNQRFVAVQEGVNYQHRDSAQYDFALSNTLVNTYKITATKWNWFYLLQFRLTEETYGISFTGEVRGLALYNSKPVINLSLSKKFDLADIFKTIVKPFTPGVSK